MEDCDFHYFPVPTVIFVLCGISYCIMKQLLMHLNRLVTSETFKGSSSCLSGGKPLKVKS